MELRPGYKQTEIGPIPEDWDAVPLGDLFTFKNGLNKAKKFFGYGTPIVNYMDVFRHPGLRLDRIEGRVDVSKSELEAFEVRKGDVFFTRTSETVEEIGVAAAMLDPAKDTVFSGFVLRARPRDERLDDLFKAYCFSPRYFRRQVVARASYTTRALTNGRSLSAAILAVPPVAEQQAIAEALSDIDASITHSHELIAKKRDLRVGTIQRLVTGQTRLMGFSDPWLKSPLIELCEMKSGEGITSARIDSDSPYPCYGGNGLRGFTKTYTHEGEYVLIGRVGALCGNILRVSGCFFASEHAIVVTPKEAADPSFLGMVLSRMKLGRLSESSAQPVLTVSKLLKLEVWHPPSKEEQSAIVRVLSDMDAEITALEARLDKTRALKQGMMQALLTGRVRLPVRAEALHALEVAHA